MPAGGRAAEKWRQMQRERKMERDNTRGKEKCRERYEIDTQREGNTERDPQKTETETGRIKERDRGRGSPSDWAECQWHLPKALPTPSWVPQSLHLLGAPARPASLLLPQISQGQALVRLTPGSGLAGDIFLNVPTLSRLKPGKSSASCQILSEGGTPPPSRSCPLCLSFPSYDKMHSLSKCSLSISCVPGPVLHGGNTE